MATIDGCGIKGLSESALSAKLKAFARAAEGNIQNFKQKIIDFKQNYPDDSVEDYINHIFNGLLTFEKGLKRVGLWISKQDLHALFNSNNKPETEEIQSKEEEISGEQRYFEDISDHFIASVYGTSTAKDKMLKSFDKNLISALFIDFDSENEIVSNQECNSRLIDYQENLFQDLKKVFKSELSSVESLFDENGKSNLPIINKLLEKIKQDYTIRNLQRMSDNPLFGQKFRAYNALFILNNFDRLLNFKYPKLITINTHEGILYGNKNQNKYIFNFRNTQINNTWRDDDKDVDINNEVSNVIRQILESINKVNSNGDDIVDSYLSFQEIATVNTLIKALPHHPNASKPILIGNKKIYLKDILIEADNEPILGMKKLYDILVHKDFPNKAFQIYEPQLRTIKALHKKIFNDKNSLFSIHQKNQKIIRHIDEQPESYYSQVIQVLNSSESIDMQEYERVQGIIRNITLKGQQELIQTYSIDNTIGGIFNVEIENPKFIHFTTNITKVEDIKEDITPVLEIKLQNGTIITREKSGIEGGTIKINGKTIEEIKIENPELLNEFIYNNRDFFREVTRFVYDSKFIELLSSKDNGYAEQLIKMSTNIIYNYEVSKQLLKFNGQNYIDNKDKYFNEKESSSIKPYTHVKQLNFINDQFTSIKINLAKTRDEYNEVTRTNVQKDAEGKQISAIGLDQIATKPEQQWERSKKGPIKNFTALKLYRGQEFARDFKGNVNKKATDFSEAENFIANFMFDYLGRIYTNDENDKQKGIVKLLPSIISDKSRIPKTLFDLNQEIPERITEDGSNMRYIDLSEEEWRQLAVTELGDYYEGIYNNFKQVMDLANKSLTIILNSDLILGKKLKFLGITTFDYDNNFQDFNSKLINLSESERVKIIKDLLHQISLMNKNSNYELIQNLHYNINKNGQLVGNAALYDQLYRWGKIDKSHPSYIAYNLESGYGTSQEFFLTKQYQYIEDLLKDNCEILLHDSYGNEFKDRAYHQFKSGEDGWKTKDNIIFAKIKYNYITESGIKNSELKITSKDDLKQSYIYKQIRKFARLYPDLYDVDATNINSQNFNLEKFIKAIKTYNENGLFNFVYNSVEKISSKYKLNHNSIHNITNNVINLLQSDKKISITSDMLESDIQDPTIPMNITNALNNLGFKIIKEFTSDNIEKLYSIFEMNEHLAKYQAIEFILGQEYMNATVGTHLNHPGFGQNLKEIESASWGAQVKRNVSLTASKYRFGLDRIDGIKSQYNIAVIEDDKDIVYNIFGRIDYAKPFDGATICSITNNYHENISLGSNKAGIDKKQFIHDYKSKSGSGIIIKTAGFSITNMRLRDSEMLQRLNKKMMDIKFKDSESKDISVRIDKDFNGNNLIGMKDNKPFSQYGDMTYVEYNSDGSETIYRTVGVKYTGINIATIYREIYDKNKKEWVKELNPQENVYLDSNYKIWKKIFGGENSITLHSNGTYNLNERSCEQLAYAMNYVGTKKDNVEIALKQSDVYQPMKEYTIDYIVTEGAIKQGAANINSKDAYFDDNYQLSTMKLNMYDAGIQLNAEHHADESVLSLMTQVLNALSARGYSMDEGDEVYQALRNLTKEALKGFDLGLEELKYGNPTEFYDFISDIILRSINTIGSTDGNLIAALSSEIKKAHAEGNKVLYNIIKDNMPISMPAIFQKMVSSIASVLTQRCIRIKFPGSMCVLAPSNKIYKIYADHLLSYHKGKKDLLPNISLIDEFGRLQVGDIKMGRTYKLEGYSESKLIDNPNDYWEIKELVKNGTITNIEEIQSVGRDLATYGARFTDKNGIVYNIWDLDSIKFLYQQDQRYKDAVKIINSSEDPIKIENALKIIEDIHIKTGYIPNDNDPYNGKEFKNFLMRKLQDTLNNLKNGGIVKIDDNDIQINNLEIQPYELIVSKIYETTFGLKQGDDVQNISKDKLFFVRRILDNFATRAESINYDVELSVLNGKHVYLLNGSSQIPSGLQELYVEYQYDGDDIVQRDLSGKIIRKVSSTSDRIFIDSKGNEIIVTNNINFYIDNTEFVHIGLSESSEPDSIKEIFMQLLFSDNNAVKSMLKNFFNIPDNIEFDLELLNNLLEENKENLRDLIIKGAIKYKEGLDILKEQLNKPNPNIDELLKIKSVQNLVIKGLETHTSFLQSLEFLAARIPAQSHQSFMAMKVVGFDESGKNTAYVSRMQIWLQGSDYDIDKVSLLGYKFKNGHFVKWSPYMDLSSKSLLEASKNLPFPTGKTLEIMDVTDNISEKNINKIDELNNLILEYQTSNSEKQIIALSKIIKLINSLGYVPSTVSNSKDILKLVNKHNNYFKNKSSKNGLINFISTKMFLVSKSPVNLIQGQSPIDDMTKIIKKLGENQAMNEKAKGFAPGSPQSKLSMLLLTLKGKENTGIVASAMKNFEACSQYYYKILKSGTKEQQERLLMNVEIFGREIRMLANAYSPNPDSLEEKVVQALQSVNNDVDAFLLFSAFLSLSTDNAKDPVLSKINAGPNMMGLYTAGLMLGFDVETLVDIMTSPVAWEIASLMNSNVFNDTQGIFNIDGIFKYLEDGPINTYQSLSGSLKKAIKNAVHLYLRKSYPFKYKNLTIDEVDINLIKSCLKNPRFNLRKCLSDSYKNDEYKEDNLENIQKDILRDYEINLSNKKEYYQKEIDKKEKEIKELGNNPNKRTLNKLNKELSKLQNYLSDTIARLEIISDIKIGKESININLRNDIEQYIEEVTIEQYELNKLDFSESYNFEEHDNVKMRRLFKEIIKYRNFNRLTRRSTIESSFDGKKYKVIDLIKKLSHVANEQSRLRPFLGLNQQLPNDIASQFKFLRNFESIFIQRASELSPNNKAIDDFKKANGDSLEINFNKFITDESYREFIIKSYEPIKAAINIFDVIANSEHYLGYAEALNANIELMKSTSTIYRIANNVSKDILNQYFNVSRNGKLHEKYIKRVQKFISYKINTQYLLSQDIVIKLPINSKMYTPDGKLIDSNGSEIILGTPHGNASFKYYIENHMIPDLQKQPGAVKLIRDLTRFNLSKTFDGKGQVNYSLTENMMPKSDYERAIFKSYKDDLNSLQSKLYNGLPVLDLLFYYNLIAYNGETNQNSLTNLFEDIFSEKTNDTVKNYINFYSEFDKEGSFELGKDFTEDELLRYIAPVENFEQGKLKYIRVYNPDIMSIELFKLKELERNNDNLDNDFDNYENDALNIEIENNNLDLDNFTDLDIQTNHLDFEEKLEGSRYERIEYNKMPRYFTNDYYDTPERISLNGKISLNENKKVFNISGEEFSYNELLIWAKSNGHDVNKIENIIIKKKIRDNNGNLIEIVDKKQTLSRIEQILEDYC